MIEMSLYVWGRPLNKTMYTQETTNRVMYVLWFQPKDCGLAKQTLLGKQLSSVLRSTDISSQKIAMLKDKFIVMYLLNHMEINASIYASFWRT